MYIYMYMYMYMYSIYTVYQYTCACTFIVLLTCYNLSETTVYMYMHCIVKC